jgi:hypothetical protein
MGKRYGLNRAKLATFTPFYLLPLRVPRNACDASSASASKYGVLLAALGVVALGFGVHRRKSEC